MTTMWKVNPDASPTHPFLLEAGRLLAEGGTVAFPTETVYGLGADACDTRAVEAIFAAKGRPSDNPLIVHIADLDQLDELVEAVDDTSRRLIDAFWPGPLTLVLPARPGAVSPRVTAGLATVAVRMPAHPVALALIRAAGRPVAAPSANRSGRPSPTLAAHVRDDLDGRIGGIVDGGPTGVGLESTVAVVEAAGGRVHVLRPGGVTVDELRRAAPHAEVTVEAAPEEALAPRSPGMKYAHYAPRGRLAVVFGDADRAVARVREALAEAKRSGERTGVLTVAEHAERYGDEADLVVPCGSAADASSSARELYAALRRFDDAGITFIRAEGFAETGDGIGLAFLNRLTKAAAHRIERV
ncbi:L-threonylcarbamoyladenylate synthase [Paenibacillus flagellatus]